MSSWEVKGYVHSGVTVKDLQTSLDFYTNILGFEYVKKQTNTAEYMHDLVNIPGLEKIEIAFVRTPDGIFIELLEYVGMDRYSGETRSCDYGTGHFCLEVENLEQMVSDLKEKGIQFKSKQVATITAGTHKGAKAVYMKDPDGYLIELMEG